MACLLCIVVLMSSSCAMAGRVDAQAPLLLEDHAVPTTSEFDITAEETEAEIMLLQEDEPSETEGSKDDSTADDAVSVNEEAAPEENTAPADSEGSQDVENEEVSNEQENVTISQIQQGILGGITRKITPVRRLTIIKRIQTAMLQRLRMVRHQRIHSLL